MRISWKRVVVLYAIFQFFFLAPLLIALFIWIVTYYCITNHRTKAAVFASTVATPFARLATTTYPLSKIGFYITGIGSKTDRAMHAFELANSIVSTGTQATFSIESFLKLMLSNKTKSKSTILQLYANKTDIIRLIPQLENYAQKLDAIYMINALHETMPSLHTASVVATQFDSLLGDGREHTYLLLFLNNKEIRPGGGFIGSLGIATFNNFMLTDLKIQDVYDVDGQLRVHVDPHPAVRTYLQNPHGFLRDSNFSPDFYEDAQKAIGFMDLSIGKKDYDGVIGITTDTIARIIERIGPIDVPEYKEVITKNNFYIKTQRYAQNDFFPGSHAKKNFLSSLTKAIFTKLPTASPQILAKTLSTSLITKDLVMYFKNSIVQTALEDANWAGRLIQPKGDYLMAVEANVGSNKANEYVNKKERLMISLGNDETTHNNYTVSFTNNSPATNSSPSMYKNYFQLYLPPDIEIEKIKINGTAIQTYEVQPNGYYTTVILYVEIPPQNTQTVEVQYKTHTTQLSKSNVSYQLDIQKQIGINAYPLDISIRLPPTSSLISQNFNADIRNGTLSKKITLDSDRHLSVKYRLNK